MVMADRLGNCSICIGADHDCPTGACWSRMMPMGRSGAEGNGAQPAGQEPMLVIVPGSVPVRQYVRDVWDYRGLLRVLAFRQITLRYRQTLLGGVWVVVQPLLSA